MTGEIFGSYIIEYSDILDSIKFNKKFKVYGSDEFEMHFLLSYSFMDRILNLDKNKEIFAFIFDDNNLYIFIKDKNKFEGNLFKDDANIEIANQIKGEISEFLLIIKVLSLTVKIYK